MGKKINELTAATDDVANANSTFLPIQVPTTGVDAVKMTIAQAKAIFGTQKLVYVATGSEGTTLTITALAGKTILTIVRENAFLHEVILPAVPDTAQFTFDGTNVGISTATGAGERFTIQYRNT